MFKSNQQLRKGCDVTLGPRTAPGSTDTFRLNFCCLHPIQVYNPSTSKSTTTSFQWFSYKEIGDILVNFCFFDSWICSGSRRGALSEWAIKQMLQSGSHISCNSYFVFPWFPVLEVFRHPKGSTKTIYNTICSNCFNIYKPTG